ncbi:unnamed protein product [Brassica oleracea]
MSSSSEIVSTIVKKWREHPPSSYSLKVDNFKQFEKTTTSSDDKYQSRLFSSGGYNWKLIVYPQGNKKDNGEGFISMYVEIDSESLTSTPQCDVFAELIFFVYNKKETQVLYYSRVLWLYPKGDSRADGKWLSHYLLLADIDKPKADEKIFVQANFRVLDPLGSDHFERKMSHWHNDKNLGWGWNKLLYDKKLVKPVLFAPNKLQERLMCPVVACGDSH